MATMRPNRYSPAAGFTLVEILVAMGIFAFIVTLLAMLLTSGLGIWQDSEGKGDAAVRAQMVLDQVQKDLASVFAEKENKVIVKNDFRQDDFPDYVYYPEPNFCCQPNAATNNQALYLTCLDSDTALVNGTTSLSYQLNRNIKRLCYGIGDGADANNLIRAVITKGAAANFWQAGMGAPQDLSPLLNAATEKRTFDGVAYLGLQLMPPVLFGQETRLAEWDSRQGDAFELLRAGTRQPQADTQTVITQTLPCTIELEVIVRPSGAGKVTLFSNVSASDNEIKLSQTRPLVGPPGYIKIDNEWMSFSKKTNFTIKVDQRGLKGSTPASHNKGAEVIYGESFKVNFIIK
ncbi:MAG: type II secretion system protein [Candidatus Brocadiia bacterium]